MSVVAATQVTYVTTLDVVELQKEEQPQQNQQAAAVDEPLNKPSWEYVKSTDPRYVAIYQRIAQRKQVVANSSSPTMQLAINMGSNQTTLTLPAIIDGTMGAHLSIDTTGQLFNQIVDQLQPGEINALIDRLKALIPKRREALKSSPSKLISLISNASGNLFGICLKHLDVLDLMRVSQCNSELWTAVTTNDKIWIQLGKKQGFSNIDFPKTHKVNPACTMNAVVHGYKAIPGYDSYFIKVKQALEEFKFLYLEKTTQEFLALPQITFKAEKLDPTGTVQLNYDDLKRLPSRFVFHLPNGNKGIGIKYVDEMREANEKHENEQLELFYGKFEAHARLRNWSCISHTENSRGTTLDKVYLSRLWKGEPCGSRNKGDKREVLPYSVNGRSVVHLIDS